MNLLKEWVQALYEITFQLEYYVQLKLMHNLLFFNEVELLHKAKDLESVSGHCNVE